MRRFIAGAICPACGEQDTLFVETQGTETHGNRVRGCTRCTFSEALDSPAPDSRDVVRIITPTNPHEKPH